MHTDRYLHFTFHYPANAKRAVSSTGQEYHTTEGGSAEKHLTDTFKQNGYPLPFIHPISSSIQKPSTPPEELENEESQVDMGQGAQGCMRQGAHREVCHQWDQQYQVNWEDTKVLDRATRPIQPMIKEASHNNI